MQPPPSSRTRANAIAILLAFGALSQPAKAQTYTYNSTIAGTESWSTSAKWSLGSGYPSGAAITAEIQRTATAKSLSLASLTPTVGRLLVGQGGTGTASWTFNGGTLTLDNGVNAAEISVSGATATFNTTLSSSKGTDFTGTASAIIANTNSRLLGGINLKGSGSVYLYYSDIAGSSAISIDAGTLRLGNATASGTFKNAISVNGSGVRGIYSNYTSKLTIEGNITGAAGVLFTTEGPGRNDTTEIKGTNTYTGATEIRTNILFHSLSNLGEGAINFTTNARSLTFATGNTADITKNNADTTREVTFSVNTTVDTGSNDVTFANAITGSGSLLKAGIGTLTLKGNNSFTNATHTAGTLEAGHANAFGGSSSNLTIQSGANLAILANKNVSIADLSLSGNVTFEFQLGSDFDSTTLAVGGSQTGSGTYTVSISADGLLTPGTYTLLTVAGTTEASGFVLASESASLGSLFWDNSAGTLTLQVIPEPSSIAFLLLGTGLFAYRKRSLWKSAALGLLIASTILPIAEAEAKSAKSTLPIRDQKADEYLNGQFRSGVYVYLYVWDQWKDPSATDLEEAINQIADSGFNYIYFGGVSDRKPELWEKVLDTCLKRKIAVVAQLDFVYLQLDSNIDSLAKRAIPFIQKYKDHPAVLAFSIKEEPGTLEWVPKLQNYYSKILEAIPDAPLHLLESVLPVMKAQLPPYPKYTGTDRYAFWWEFSQYNNRATPRAALAWFRTQSDAFYQIAESRGQNFELVFTDWIQQLTIPADRLRANIYPKDISDEERQEAFERYLRLAKEGKQGLSYNETENQFLVWKYYTPPTNCMSALAWLGVMEGAQSVSVYLWSKPRTNVVWHKTKGTGYTSSGLLGWEMQGTPALTEYSAFARDLRPFGRLIRSLKKETTALLKVPEGHEIAETAPLQNPILATKEKDLSWRSFHVPGFQGKVVILVNTRVGSWSNQQSPTQLSDNDDFRIDQKGRLIDYVSYHLPRSVSLQINEAKSECVDLMTGKPIPMAEDGNINLPILPGRGSIVYIGETAVKDYPKLVAKFDLQPVR